MLNIVVFVSGGGTNLQAIIDAIKDGRISNGQIACVISSRQGVFAIERATQNNIKAAVISRKNFVSQEEYDQDILDKLKHLNTDLIVLAGYMSILSKRITDKYQNKIINVHPALIPSFCGDGFYGLKVHQAALERGVKVSGATVHFVNEVTDGGPIILQKSVEVQDNDTPEILQKRVMEQVEWELLPRAIDLFCNDKLEITQNIVKIKE
jgi:phosphoribosylglycinamide formyltransferase-1